ncbi:hypothetical protein [Vreelandella venusta]|uniref:Uncharacterized protein n=1 Tax=Vreelandella venusta TaxID=44935 RepID=A0ABX2B7B6_9GAMM|nr:hypothetical protein [Halomonas venusta]AZM96697.1 hypothetical protein EI420_13870 [Halomonas venusta]MDX1355246.1 hypothetical protein [Halomonas venusta]NPT29980.1 hypothetical protein [Halomonas venusta]QPI62985.1 hypothetical protein IR195_13975 [Halomonas venusta]WAM50995.1 hypothetical protein L0520_11945 [Halomonas venusta]
MSKMPKSVVLEGRRYPTWVLSSRARAQLVNLQQVDAHIAELRERLAHYSMARTLCQQRLLNALPKPLSLPAGRCYWHTVPREWVELSDVSCPLHAVPGGHSYQEGDTLVVYIKGLGVVGWGAVTVDSSSVCHFTWRCRVASMASVIPAKTLSQFALRHPTRPSQRLPSDANIGRLFEMLNSRSLSK